LDVDSATSVLFPRVGAFYFEANMDKITPATCGKTFCTTSTHDKEVNSTPFYCRQWRVCPDCLMRRIKAEQARVVDFLYKNKNTIAKLELIDIKDEKRYRRKLRNSKVNYRRYLTDDGAYFLVFKKVGRKRRRTISAMLKDIDFKVLVCTIEGTRISGNIKAPKRKGMPIKVFDIITNAPQYTQRKFMRKAVESTRNKIPESPKEVEDILNETAKIYEELLKIAGYVTYRLPRTKYILSMLATRWHKKREQLPIKIVQAKLNAAVLAI